MRRRLTARFGKTSGSMQMPEHAVLFEVPVDGVRRWEYVDNDGTRQQAEMPCRRSIDALAVGLWRRTDHLIHGFEIKATRADLRAELRDPDKSEPARRLCDRWWLVLADRKLLGDDAPPEGWGVLYALRAKPSRAGRTSPDRGREGRPVRGCARADFAPLARRLRWPGARRRAHQRVQAGARGRRGAGAPCRAHAAHPAPIRGGVVTTYRLMLPFERPPLTANQARSRTHWSTQRDAKIQVQRAVWALAKQAKVPRLERCVVALTWFAVGRGKRDSDGVALMAKAGIDGLVQAGVLEDDDSTRVPSVLLSVVTGAKPARVELLVLTGASMAPFVALLAA
jgi:hypothetical protein